mgnify:CR=1 FL=1|jgi:hypothetical protein
MKNTELQMNEGMRLHREMQNRQVRQMVQYAGGIARRLDVEAVDGVEAVPSSLNSAFYGSRRSSINSIDASSQPSSRRVSLSSQNVSRRSSLNWEFDDRATTLFNPVNQYEEHNENASGLQNPSNYLDVITLEGNDVVEDQDDDDGELFDFLFD